MLMNQRYKATFSTKVILSILITLTLLMLPSLTFANSTEPPALIIIVNESNDALNITLDDNHTIYAKRLIRPFDMQFNIYYHDLAASQKSLDELSITVTGSGDPFSLSIPHDNTMYRNIYTLDMSTKTLTQGQSLVKSIVYIGTRMLFTLVIEAMLLNSFGFREKRSWLIFLLMNLSTQGFLNITLSNIGIMGGYLMLSLVFIEVFILIFEGACFGFLAKEKTALRRILYVVVANIISLFLGGYLLMILPI